MAKKRVNITVDPALHNKAKKILASSGMTVSSAVNILFIHIVTYRSFPLEILFPDEENMGFLNTFPDFLNTPIDFAKGGKNASEG